MSSRPLAVVTGASSGIGRAFARRLAADGHDVALVARDRTRLEALAGELREAHGIRAEVWPADLADAAASRGVAERIAAADDLDVLVHAAGFLHVGALETLDPEREDEAVRLMAGATVRLARAALPKLLERGHGSIVVVSSRAAFTPSAKDIATYAACKAFVNHFVLSLAERVRGTGVRALAVCPGNTRTEIFERAGLDMRELPESAWSTPEQVVDEALRELEAGANLCVPGERGRDVTLRRLLPRRLLAKASGILRRLSRT